MTGGAGQFDDLEAAAAARRQRIDADERERLRLAAAAAQRVRSADEQGRLAAEAEARRIRELGEQFRQWVAKHGVKPPRSLFSRGKGWTIASRTIYTDMGDSRSPAPPPQEHSVLITPGGKFHQAGPKNGSRQVFGFDELREGVVDLMARLLPPDSGSR